MGNFGRQVKIFSDGELLYDAAASVNMAFLRGKICKNPILSGRAAKFTLQVSNGKNQKTGEWNKPTYADCRAFGELSEKIIKRYRAGDEIWIVGKYHVSVYNDRICSGFWVRDVIGMKEQQTDDEAILDDQDLPF